MRKKFGFRKAIALLLLAALLSGCGPKAETAQDQGAAAVNDETAKISYLGPEGTYTQEACEVFFGEQGLLSPYVTVQEAVEALVRKKVDYAVIPQENTIGGAVTDYLDVLISQPDVYVTGEVELPISQNLLTLPETELGEIRTVYSHKQGIAQGREWLAENLPDAEVIEVSSTAEGARMVAEAKDPSCAAIASVGCAKVYDLKILAAGIQNNDQNKTRFYVLSCEEPRAEAGDRLARPVMIHTYTLSRRRG